MRGVRRATTLDHESRLTVGTSWGKPLLSLNGIEELTRRPRGGLGLPNVLAAIINSESN